MEPKKLKKVMGIILLGAVVLAAGFSQKTEDPGVMLRSAIEKEEVDGDLSGAIDIYQAIIQKFRANKSMAAQAQLRIGLCYEKLGDKSIEQAQLAFQKVIDNFPTQSNEVQTARERLFSLARPKSVPRITEFAVTHLDFSVPGYSMEAFDLSPDGTKMLGVEFDKGQNIVVVDLINKKVKYITEFNWSDNFSWTYNPVWSPDGKEIAYNANKQGPDGRGLPNGRSLMVATLDGRSRTLLRNDKYWFFPNAWMPDGSAIVTMRGEYKDNTQELGLVPSAGGEFKKLISLHGNVANSGGSRAHASVSPDGRFIAFTDLTPSKHKDIFIMNADGNTSWPLLDHPAGARLPRWSPDGKHIAFLSPRHGSWALWAVKVEEGRTAGDPFLIRDGMQESNLQNWTSHGLVYIKWIGIRDIYRMDLDPQTGEPLGKPNVLDFTPTGGNLVPTWSPDGRQLAFTRSDDQEGQRFVVVVGKDGSDPREFPVPRGYTRLGYLRWLPDGTGIGLVCGDFEYNNFILHLDMATKQWKSIKIPVEGSWARFEWSGNGKAFFYSKNGMPEQGAGIYERNLETGAERLIYQNPESRVNFRWLRCSRDYRCLTFMESNTKNMVVNLETGESIQAASRQGFSTWSSDGHKLLGLRTYGMNEGFKKVLSVFAASGGPVQEFELREGLPEKGRFSSPDWSPDGKHLAFVFIQSRRDVLLFNNIIPGEKKY
jgi:Tol biopolymer transport system component